MYRYLREKSKIFTPVISAHPEQNLIVKVFILINPSCNIIRTVVNRFPCHSFKLTARNLEGDIPGLHSLTSAPEFAIITLN